jgi:hypothetical protein
MQSFAQFGMALGTLTQNQFPTFQESEDTLTTFRRIGTDIRMFGIWRVARPSTAQT